MSGPNVASRPGRRSGRRKFEALEAAARVIAERGVDAARFVDVSSESGIAVSSLQYYFGSREDLVIAAFRHASETELLAVRAELATRDDPWERICFIIEDALSGYRSGDDVSGRLWIEAWRFGLRDDEMRSHVQYDYATWHELLASAIEEGSRIGRFTIESSPQDIAIVALAMLDGVGLRLAVSDPLVSYERANATVVGVLRQLLNMTN